MKKLFTQHKDVATFIAVALILAVVGALLARLWLPQFDILEFVSVAATLAIAMLTVAYVLVTSSQLGVMQQQLGEMARTRELEAQPLPYLEIKKVFFERPRFFYTPPEDQYHANPRLLVAYRLVNRGSHPAVNIVSAAKVVLKIDDEEFVFDGGADEISVLGPQAEHPPESSSTEHFLFTENYLTRLVAGLRDRSFRSPPLLSVRLIYRNVLGACFAGTWYFQLSPKSEKDFEVLGNWESQLVSFDARYKDQISELRRVQNKDDERWSEVFEKVKNDFDNSLKGDTQFEVSWFEVPNSYRTAVLNKEKYSAELKQLDFGRPIPRWIAGCVAKASDQ
jgi:hypothetical protein